MLAMAVVLLGLAASCRYDLSGIPSFDPEEPERRQDASPGSGPMDGGTGGRGSQEAGPPDNPSGRDAPPLDGSAPPSDARAKGEDAEVVEPDGAPPVHCGPGFVVTDAGTCADEDECRRPDACAPPTPYCENTAGGYECNRCPRGHRLVAGNCEDIDECARDNDCDRHAFCTNLVGGYECRCPAFYTDPAEPADGRECSDERTEWWRIVLVNENPLITAALGDEFTVVGAYDEDGVDFTGQELPAFDFNHDRFIARLDPNFRVKWLKQLDATDHLVETLDHDAQGNVIVGGLSGGARFVAKYAGVDGARLWRKFLQGASNNPEVPTAVSADSEGNVALCGAAVDTFAIDAATRPHRGNTDVYVVKLSPAGELLWAVTFGGPSGEWCTGIATDSEGGAFIVGNFDESFAFDPDPELITRGEQDGFLAKLTPSGEVVWSMRLGGDGRDRIAAVAVGPDGEPVVVGEFYRSFQAGTVSYQTRGFSDVFVMKWSADGRQVRWSHRLGGTGEDVVRGVAIGLLNEVVVAGGFAATVDLGEGTRSSVEHTDAMLQKYAADGRFIFSHDLGGPGDDVASRPQVDALGRIFVTTALHPSSQAPIDFDHGVLTQFATYLRRIAP